jgi:hypothetical protein
MKNEVSNHNDKLFENNDRVQVDIDDISEKTDESDLEEDLEN